MAERTTPALEKARETFEQEMMKYGLEGNLYEWIDIHDAIDAYTEAVVEHARSTEESGKEDDPLEGNPYDLDADELAPNGRRDETPIDADEPIESVFRT